MTTDNLAKKNTIDLEYVKLLELEVYKKYPGKTKQNISKILGFGPTTFHNLFNSGIGIVKTVNEIAQQCDFISYEEFSKRKPSLSSIRKRLTEGNGVWVSYCFTSRRRLYKNVWTFKEKLRPNPEPKSKTDKKNKEHIDDTYIEVKRESIDFTYLGELLLNPDLTLEIKVQNDPNYRIEYFSLFPDEKEPSFYKNFTFIECEAHAYRKKTFFTTLEVFVKPSSNQEIAARKIEYDVIRTGADKNKIPDDDAYLAFNFLNKNVSKARRIIDNYSINQKMPQGNYLEYKHNIFISCPVSYITTEKEFSSLRNSVDQIINVLIEDYGFIRENIYCEIVKYNSFDEVQKDDRHLFFESRKLINSTHFIALIPQNLGSYNSGMYMEIFHRISNRLPALIFTESRSILPSLLQGLLDAPNRPININFKDCELPKIANYMHAAKNYLFQFSM